MSTVSHQPEIWKLEDLQRHGFCYVWLGQIVWTFKGLEISPLNSTTRKDQLVFIVKVQGTGEHLNRLATVRSTAFFRTDPTGSEK